MSIENTFHKKRLALAIGAALALSISVSAYAADGDSEPEKEDIKLDNVVNNKVEWTNGGNKDKVITATAKDESVTSVTIENEGSITNASSKNYVTFKNLDIKVGEKGSLTNKGTIHLNKTLTVSGGTFDNSGTFVVGTNEEAAPTNPDKKPEGNQLDEVTGGVSVYLSNGANFTNTGTIDVQNGDFTLNIAYNPKTEAEKPKAEDTEPNLGTFNNEKGTIKMNGGKFTVKPENDAQAGYEEGVKNKVSVVLVGNVEMNGGVLSNEDTGYSVKVPKKEEEQPSDKPNEAPKADEKFEYKQNTTVSFGTVTLKDNAKFVSQKDAREDGEALKLDLGSKAYFGGETASARTDKPTKEGYSKWNSIWINHEKTPGEQAKEEPKPEAAKNYVTVQEGHTLELGAVKVTGKFDGVANEIVSSSKAKQEQEPTSLIFTKGSKNVKLGGVVAQHEGELNLTFDAGIDYTRGFGVTANNEVVEADLKKVKVEDSEEFKNPEKRNSKLTISGFNASISEKTPSTQKEGEEPPKEPEYTVTSYDMNLAVGGMSEVTLKDNFGSNSLTNADFDMNKVKSDAKFADNSKVAALTGKGMTFSDTWAQVSVDEYKQKKDEDSKPQKANEGEEDKFDFSKYNKQVADTVVKTQKIEKSDIILAGQFGILTNKNDEDAIENIKFESYLNSEGNSIDEPEDLSKFDKTTHTSDEKKEIVKQHVSVIGSHIQAQRLEVQSGSMEFTSSTGAFASAGRIDGSFSFVGDEKNYLSIGMLPTEDDLKKARGEETKPTKDANTGNLIFLGQGVNIGTNGVFNIGVLAPIPFNGDETDPKPEEKPDNLGSNSQLNIARNTTIVFTGELFDGSNALFNGTLGESKTNPETNNATANFTFADGEKLNLKGSDLGVGAFLIVDGFNEVGGLEAGNIDVSGVTPDKAWGDIPATKVEIDKENNIYKFVVGGETIQEVGLNDINAANLTNNVLRGNRSGDKVDQYVISHILRAVHQKDGDNDKKPEFSKAEATNQINSVTGFNAVTGIKALTVDFQSYVADQVEHHATRVPHNMGGWWIQPIGAKLKTDGLSAGSLTTGYSLNTYGIMGGLDTTLRNGDIWGLAGSWQTGDADSEGDAAATKTEVKNYGVHLWAARHYDDLAIMLMASYLKTTADATMQTVVGELAANDLESTAYSFGIRADLTKNFGSFELVPHVGARVLNVDMKDFTSKFKGYDAFNYSDDKVWLFEVPVGVTAKTAFEFQRWNVQPYADLTLRGRFGDTSASYEVSGMSGVKDSLDYDITGNFVGDLTLGYMSTFKDLNLGMSYGFSAGDAGRQNHRFEATLRLDYE